MATTTNATTSATGVIQFGGLISGLKTSDIIDALMTAEKAPLQRLQQQGTDLQTQRAALVAVGTSLSTLLAKVQAFTTTKTGASRTATSSNPSIFGATASAGAAVGQYQVSVDRLATATRAVSTAPIGTAITDATAHADVTLDPTKSIANLNLPGAVTAGQVTIVVDGKLLHLTVDPSQNLASALDGIAALIQAQAQLTDPGVHVAASVVANRVQMAVSGGAGSHTISFSAADDTSNALGILGLSSVSATNATNPTLTGTTSLGVARTSVPLDSAGLSGLTSTTTGKLTINGVDIAYDTTSDSLTTLISRINASQAGVIASLDRTNDKVVLTRSSTGSQAMAIADTSGTLAAALDLAPGTTNAQVLGTTAQVTVDGRTVVSDSNHVTNAIDGVALDLTGQSPIGTPTTLTVGIDRTSIQNALNDFVTSFNALGDLLDQVTQNTPGTQGQAGSAGPLATDNRVSSLFLTLRSLVAKPVAGLTGSITSLADLGVNTGAVGASVGTTDRLQLDTTKLSKALDTDPARVAQLLGDATGALQPLADQLTSLTGTSGFVQAGEQRIDTSLHALSQQEDNEQVRIDLRQADLERKYAALESLLAQLQVTSSSVTSQVNSMLPAKSS